MAWRRSDVYFTLIRTGILRDGHRMFSSYTVGQLRPDQLDFVLISAQKMKERDCRIEIIKHAVHVMCRTGHTEPLRHHARLHLLLGSCSWKARSDRTTARRPRSLSELSADASVRLSSYNSQGHIPVEHSTRGLGSCRQPSAANWRQRILCQEMPWSDKQWSQEILKSWTVHRQLHIVQLMLFTIDAWGD